MDGFPHHFAGEDGRVLVVEAPELLDHHTADHLRAQIIATVPDRDSAAVIIDMSGCRGLTSIGVTALLQTQEFCRDQSAACWLIGVTREVERVFAVLRLSHRFPAAEDQESALAQIEADAVG
ncbi:MAG: STAS domain-containing protein [Planctomycetota bacterium]